MITEKILGFCAEKNARIELIASCLLPLTSCVFWHRSFLHARLTNEIRNVFKQSANEVDHNLNHPMAGKDED